MGQFYYSCKAFDLLEHMDPNPEYWEGKRGACIGLFQQIIAENEPKETLREVLQILKTTASPQVRGGRFVLCCCQEIFSRSIVHAATDLLGY
jgi:hypothetical protein